MLEILLITLGAGALNAAIEDLAGAAQLLREMADGLAANGGDDVPNVAYDAERFIAHLRETWDFDNETQGEIA